MTPLTPPTYVIEAIQDLIDPISAQDFLDQYWDSQILYIQRNDPIRYQSLLTIGDLDKILSGVTLPIGNIDLAKDSTSVPKEAFTIAGMPNIREILRRHSAGATIILRALHKWHRPLQQLRLALESFFHCSVHANVYVTPSQQKSSPPHWDTHDLLILQIHGKKMWRIVKGDYRLPLSSQRFRPGMDPIGGLDQEILMGPGDLLYLPRGTIHEPKADDYSIHIALGIHVKTYSDLIKSMLAQASIENESMRRCLPLLGVERDDPIVFSLVGQFLALLNDERLVGESLRAVREAGLEACRPPEGRNLENVAGITSLSPDSVLRRKKFITPILLPDGGGVQLILGDSQIFLGPKLKEAAVFLREREVFAVRDIPGEFSNSHRCSLAYTLVMDKAAFDLD